MLLGSSDAPLAANEAGASATAGPWAGMSVVRGTSWNAPAVAIPPTNMPPMRELRSMPAPLCCRAVPSAQAMCLGVFDPEPPDYLDRFREAKRGHKSVFVKRRWAEKNSRMLPYVLVQEVSAAEQR